jgi:hypothetical protein
LKTRRANRFADSAPHQIADMGDHRLEGLGKYAKLLLRPAARFWADDATSSFFDHSFICPSPFDFLSGGFPWRSGAPANREAIKAPGHSIS